MKAFFNIRDVDEVKRLTGIELRGDDGQPYCCGQRMNVKGGIMGPDYARCKVCGQEIGNYRSPHISGSLLGDAWFDDPKKTWAQIQPKEEAQA